MRFRPCIDIHDGKVKQIVGSTLTDDSAVENFIAENGADYFANIYKEHDLPGGHIILLNKKGTPEYEMSKSEAFKGLAAYPGCLQIGGGVDAENAKEFIDAGASHVIVTSFVFKDGQINEDNLKKLVSAVGKEHVVLDLSCRKRDDEYYIATDRWQNLTEVKICKETLDYFSEFADEFLIHAVDVEGKQNGIEIELVGRLAAWNGTKITYAGGVKGSDDIELLKIIGQNKIDATIGSALDLFGGKLKFEDVLKLTSESI